MKKLIYLFLTGLAIGLFTGCSLETSAIADIGNPSIVYVSPSLGIAQHFVAKSGVNHGFLIVGIIALIAAGILIFLMFSDRMESNAKKWLVVLILLAIAFGGFFGKILSVSSNNTKQTTWENLDRHLKLDPTGMTFWDSIYQSNRMGSCPVKR